VNIGSTSSDERYEVVLKHYSMGVLHRASFKTLKQARTFLMARWNGLPANTGRTQFEYGAIIYDKHESRKCLSTLGAVYLVNEDHAKNRQ
jgi:hypothetical protein